VVELKAKIEEEAYDDWVDITYSSLALIEELEEKLINRDFYLVGGALIFIWMYLQFHLGSRFLAFIGIILILFNVPLTTFIFKVIFRITYINSNHFLIIFMILPL